ncbi:transposase [Roseobacter sp. SK209-2-6]|uniref:transposase n=1 Tax=Roseobacter sp. SK209-2-6 TaxID=388739 RepID=UPI003FA43F04
MQICLTMTVLFRKSLRQTSGIVENLLQPTGLDWKETGTSTLCRDQKALNVASPDPSGC